jgi:predicted phage baseplate assembly protein
MSDAPDTSALDACGCCDPAIPLPRLGNQAGLPALAYRISTHPGFLRRMLAALPAQQVRGGLRPLARLTTRAGDDPTIALLDAWATLADVLTFYQERVANEGFLRTATERRSVLELARLIGYELRPGVAASAYLAFTVDDSPGSPGTATIPAGTKVQSLPAKGELPQTFEVSATITADAAWNALRPRLTQPQPLDPDAAAIYLDGMVVDVKPGGVVLFVTPGDHGAEATPKQVTAVQFEEALQRTRVDLVNPPKPPPPFVYKPLRPFSVPTLEPLVLNAVNVQTSVLEQDWRGDDLAAFIGIQGWGGASLVAHVGTTIPKAQIPAPIEGPSNLPPAQPGVYTFKVQTGPFGHNAPRWDSLPTEQRTGSDAPYPKSWDDFDDPTEPPAPPITKDSDREYYPNADFFLERTVPEVVPGGWVVLEGSGSAPTPYRVEATVETSLADFALSARATGVTVTDPDGSAKDQDELDAFMLRSTTIRSGSQPLELAALPIDEPLGSGTAEERQLTLDSLVLGLEAGQPLILTGERADLPGVTASEVVILSDVVHSAGLTTLFWETGLAYPYLRKTVTLNANVAAATHGETVGEVLGSGDGGQANQRFTLKKPPLTYVAAPTPSGTQSSLQVQVDGVRWQEVPALFGFDERSRSYIVRIDDDAKATVIFGDGRQGARLPTGTENVTATYRSGIGLQGLVAEHSLTLLQTRPPGVRGVTNPVAASGAADPENLDSARDNAPLGVLTLDRIVSLRDFEDFARGFAGVGKAQAVAFWLGETHLVHVTVAAVDGAVVDPTSALHISLVQAIGAVADPVRQFQVDPHQPLFFNLAAKLLVHPDYQPDAVFDAVRAALLSAFSFERRAFGQPVTAAEVVTAVQQVAGVVAVDLDQLYRVDDPGGHEQQAPVAVVGAARATLEGGLIRPAQLLLVSPVGITLLPMEEAP